jgi:Cof subfamily protein (haloacid dehalogenase superfamily)
MEHEITREDIPRRMVVTDLDGTLLRSNREVSDTDLNTLQTLGKDNILRVMATGRNLYSAKKVLADEFPFDYLIFSSGAGIVDWRTKRIIKKHALTAGDVRAAVKVLRKTEDDFMIHDPIPNNHYFIYYNSGKNNPDFLRRFEIYKEFAKEEDLNSCRFQAACQIIAIEPSGRKVSNFKFYSRALNSLKIIRTTSPIDGKSTWIEIFPKEVSKARASEWIGAKHDIFPKDVLAVGNDFNDLDLLNWAETGILVANAPDELKEKFPIVGSNNDDGFSEAVKRWV